MVLVLGIGNSLLQDEGIGYHLLQYLTEEKSHWPVKFLDGGTLSFNLTGLIETYDKLIVLDAANFNQPAGTVKTLLNNELDDFLSKPGKSVHEVSLSEVFDMMRLTETLPTQRAMVAVQPKTIGWGDKLTEQVDAAQLDAAEHIEKVLQKWGVLTNTADENAYEV
jgi:hydrogenase maturation protease